MTAKCNQLQNVSICLQLHTVTSEEDTGDTLRIYTVWNVTHSIARNNGTVSPKCGCGVFAATTMMKMTRKCNEVGQKEECEYDVVSPDTTPKFARLPPAGVAYLLLHTQEW